MYISIYFGKQQWKHESFFLMFRILLLLLNFGNDKKYMYITIYGIIVLDLWLFYHILPHVNTHIWINHCPSLDPVTYTLVKINNFSLLIFLSNFFHIFTVLF